MRKKQILIRLTAEEHRVFAAKARAAGVSIQALVREKLRKLPPTRNGAYLRLEQILLARIGVHLSVITERCRNLDDRAATMEILERLTGVEGELRERAAVRKEAC